MQYSLKILAGAFFIVALIAVPRESQAQNLVFKTDFDYKYKFTGKKLMSSSVLIDKVTNEKLLLVSTMRDLAVFHLDAEWKLIKRFDHEFVKESGLSKDDFKILANKKSGDTWTLLVESKDGDLTIEELNPVAQALTVKETLYDSKTASKYFTREFSVNGIEYRMSLNKKNELMMHSFDEGLNQRSVKLDLSTSMPYEKKSPYTTGELFETMKLMDTLRVMGAHVTRYPVHFYIEQDKYILSVTGRKPEAEVSYYNKATGSRTQVHTYSVESLLPADAKGDAVNSAFLFFDKKAWLLSAYKNGGVLGVFDTATKKLVYQFAYTDKSDKNIFNYGPVKFENWVKREKVDDISMDDYAKDLSKRIISMHVKPVDRDTYYMILGTYEEKADILLAYISSNAGLTFTREPFVRKEERINYYTAQVKATADAWKTPKPKLNDSYFGPWGLKQPWQFSRQFIRNAWYEVHFERGVLRVTEELCNCEE